MKVVVNGKESETPEEMTILSLLQSLKVEPQLVAVDVNDAIIKRKEFATTRIHHQDRIEILQMIGGG